MVSHILNFIATEHEKKGKTYRYKSFYDWQMIAYLFW